MLPASKTGRTVLGGAVVLAASLLAVLAARAHYKPYAADSPSYRRTGDPAARIVIVEYSDFECPACSAGHATMKSVLSAYGKDIRLIFKHYPLERPHPSARAAAVAAECAGRQGAFWQYHDRLFERQREWVPRGPESAPPSSLAMWFAKYASDLHLDAKAFSGCLADPAVDAAVASDMEEGKTRLVSATPTFFVAGKRFVGSRQLSTLGTLWIEKKLKDR
ncbi:MAG: thioredoxin domain-containing protein [Elusimicrobia bacterium]|nr:thioredoxin domain-containing protein [Elusimicrobiota bacterium]